MNRRSLIKCGAAGLVVALCLFLAACSSDEIRKAAKTASVGITTLHGLRDTNKSLLTHRKITKDESDANVRLMQGASAAFGQVNDRAREANNKIVAIDAKLVNDPDNATLKAERAQIVKSASQDLKPLVKAALQTIRNLNDQGVLRVKNAEARTQLSDLMGVLLDLL